ncbi:MAG: hypothetical protein ABSE73_20120 [Planctomycetota bacterium]
MNKPETEAIWSEKGATLSDKSAREEFGLTQGEIIQGIKRGGLQVREGSMYGNPWLRLLRSEVEALVDKKYGGNYLKEKEIRKELAQTEKELRMLKSKMARLEKRKAELLASLDE